jgi:iron complex outermembrane receptor protein
VTDITARGLFLVEDFHTGAVTIEIGARVNRDEYSPQHALAPGQDFSTYSFSGSALWDFSAPATLGLSVSRSQRAPSVEELYSNYGLAAPEDCVIHFATGACELGDTGFGEETSLNTDLTLYLDYGRFSATLTGFYNSFADYIGQVTTGQEVAGFPVRRYQQDDARFTGIEVDVNLELNDLAALRVFGDTINGSFDTNGDVPRMPPKRYGLELTLSGEAWSAYATLLHATAQDKPGAFEVPTDSWTRVDVGADYTLDTGDRGEVLLFIKGRNIGDEEIRMAASYLRGFAPEAGRSIEAGVRYRF